LIDATGVDHDSFTDEFMVTGGDDEERSKEEN
jgi:hypothetical protein